MIGSLIQRLGRLAHVAGLDRPLISLGQLLARGRYHVLTYHRVNDDGHPLFPAVSTDRFAVEMEMVARCFRVLPLTELVDRAASGTLPRGALAITFDDGYRDNFTHALPVLRRLGLPATVFLATGAIDRSVPLWHDRLFDAVRDTKVDRFEWNGGWIELRGDRRRAIVPLLADLKRKCPDERDEVLGRLLLALDIEMSPPPTDHILTWDDVRLMARHDIDFGAHTVSHTILTNLEPADAAAEVRDSVARIEHELQRPVELFAYPNGATGDFDSAVQAAVRSAGIRGAVTTIWGANDAASDPLALRRVSIIDREPWLSALRLTYTHTER